MTGKTVITTRAEFSGISALKFQCVFFPFGVVANLFQVGAEIY
jgi:hypothetical protein